MIHAEMERNCLYNRPLETYQVTVANERAAGSNGALIVDGLCHPAGKKKLGLKRIYRLIWLERGCKPFLQFSQAFTSVPELSVEEKSETFLGEGADTTCKLLSWRVARKEIIAK